MVTNNNGISREKQEKLHELTEVSSNNQTAVQTQQLYELLLLYTDVYACGNNDVSRTNKIQLTIHTDALPVRQLVCRLPPAKWQEVQKLLKDMHEKDVIEPSASPWVSPIVLVCKKDGSTRFCVDYRKLNSVSRKDAYPLPCIDGTPDTLAGAQWFSTLDLISGVAVGRKGTDLASTIDHTGSTPIPGVLQLLLTIHPDFCSNCQITSPYDG